MAEIEKLTVSLNVQGFDAEKWSKVAMAALDQADPDWRDKPDAEEMALNVVRAMVSVAFERVTHAKGQPKPLS